VAGREIRDASGSRVVVPRRPRRVVSLVPSVTETLYALGLGELVVGVTDWCIHPAAALASVPRVGGTKNPDVARVAARVPDLVLANLEENREIDVRRLRDRGLCVWVDYPRTIAAAVAQIAWLADLGAGERARRDVLDPIEDALARARSRTAAPRSAFVAVWKRPWMTISADTYASDLLTTAGLANVFAGASGHYPRIDLAEVARRDPEIVLLPDEPYRFTADDARELASGALSGTRAARADRIVVFDGTLAFWHGPRIAAAVDALLALADD
jgi:ABC-type Fe3+-hydroxamate transport system substrate-binding protein